MKINTPVKIEDSSGMYNAIVESTGEYIGDLVTTELADEVAKRINLHEKLIILLKESKFALSQQYGVDSMFLDEVNNVLEQCK